MIGDSGKRLRKWRTLSEDWLNTVVVPKRVKDERTISLMDKMRDAVEFVNSNSKSGNVTNDVLIFHSDDIEKYGTSYVIRHLALQGVCSIERWKLLPNSCFCLCVKKSADR